MLTLTFKNVDPYPMQDECNVSRNEVRKFWMWSSLQEATAESRRYVPGGYNGI